MIGRQNSSEIGQLTNLTRLILHNNNFPGEIPAELGESYEPHSFYAKTITISRGEIPIELSIFLITNI